MGKNKTSINKGFSDAVREILKEKRMTFKSLNETLGVAPQTMSTRLLRNNPTLNVVIDMLDALDYEVVLQPKRRGKYADGAIPLSKGEDK